MSSRVFGMTRLVDAFQVLTGRGVKPHKKRTRFNAIDLGVELLPQPRKSELVNAPVRSLNPSEVAVISFLEGHRPAALPVSPAEVAKLEGELAALQALDPLEAFAFCHEWILSQGSFRHFMQKSEADETLNYHHSGEPWWNGGAYAT
jgi:hypothetical protein